MVEARAVRAARLRGRGAARGVAAGPRRFAAGRGNRIADADAHADADGTAHGADAHTDTRACRDGACRAATTARARRAAASLGRIEASGDARARAPRQARAGIGERRARRSRHPHRLAADWQDRPRGSRRQPGGLLAPRLVVPLVQHLSPHHARLHHRARAADPRRPAVRPRAGRGERTEFTVDLRHHGGRDDLPRAGSLERDRDSPDHLISTRHRRSARGHARRLEPALQHQLRVPAEHAVAAADVAVREQPLRLAEVLLVRILAGPRRLLDRADLLRSQRLRLPRHALRLGQRLLLARHRPLRGQRRGGLAPLPALFAGWPLGRRPRGRALGHAGAQLSGPVPARW